MTTAAQRHLPHRGRGHAWGEHAGRSTPPAQRGELRIADRVLARIAWLAAREALAAAAWQDLPVQGDPPRVKVSVAEGVARVRVGVDLPYPSDLAVPAVAVRDAVADRLATLTGVPVREVTVVVEHLWLREDVLEEADVLDEAEEADDDGEVGAP